MLLMTRMKGKEEGADILCNEGGLISYDNGSLRDVVQRDCCGR